jgi:hypothetical protein
MSITSAPIPSLDLQAPDCTSIASAAFHCNYNTPGWIFRPPEDQQDCYCSSFYPRATAESILWACSRSIEDSSFSALNWYTAYPSPFCLTDDDGSASTRVLSAPASTMPPAQTVSAAVSTTAAASLSPTGSSMTTDSHRGNFDPCSNGGCTTVMSASTRRLVCLSTMHCRCNGS